MKLRKGHYIGTLCQHEHRYKRRKKSLRNKNGGCVVCSTLHEALRWKKNKKEIKKRNAIYYKKNKESILKRQNEWYLKNKKKVNERLRIRYKNNREVMNKYNLANYHKNKVLKK
jgi:hypothetical protein